MLTKTSIKRLLSNKILFTGLKKGTKNMFTIVNIKMFTFVNQN
jgi:hypothetical protein